MNKRELKAAQDSLAKLQLVVGSSHATPSEKSQMALAFSEAMQHLELFFQEQWIQFRRQAAQHSIEIVKGNHQDAEVHS